MDAALALAPHDLTKSEHLFDPISDPINAWYFHLCAGAQQPYLASAL